MLATVDPGLLDRVAFPLGGQGKRATRDEAAAAGLAVARRKESQEACFLAGSDYRAFLERQGLARRTGPIVDEGGAELGRHDGVWRYTPGQRRGIGIARPSPTMRSAPTPPRTRSWSARGARSRCARSRPRAAVPAARSGRGEAALPLRSGARPRRADGEGLPAPARASRRRRSRPARWPCSTTTTPSSERASSWRQAR